MGHVADVQRDPQLHPLALRRLIALVNAPLELDRAEGRAQRARELDQEPVPHGLDLCALELGEHQPDDLPMLVDEPECGGLVALAQRGIPDDVGQHDRREPTPRCHGRPSCSSGLTHGRGTRRWAP